MRLQKRINDIVCESRCRCGCKREMILCVSRAGGEAAKKTLCVSHAGGEAAKENK